MPFASHSIARNLCGTLACWALVCSVTPGWGQERLSDDAQHWSALEEALDADCRDGQLQQHALLEAACITSGVLSAAELATYRQRWDAACGELVVPHTASADTLELAKWLLEQLHDRLLQGAYRADATALTCILDGGDFNCVSATILYQELGARHGLATHAVATKTHVYSRLTNPAVAVETTRRDGIRTDRPVAATLDLRETRELSPVQLLAKVYYNRGVAALQQQDYAGAMRFLQRACAWDPEDRQARANWLAAVNNGALAAQAAQQWSTAAELIRTGLAVEPQHACLLANDLHIHQQWSLELCDRGQFAEALEMLEARRQARPDQPLFAVALADVQHRCKATVGPATKLVPVVALDPQTPLEIATMDADDRDAIGSVPAIRSPLALGHGSSPSQD